jgi:hypothetical protein
MPVESARSQNITVACRRSPTASGIGRPGLCGNGSGAGATATADFSLASKFKIALSSRIRCPKACLASQGGARSAQGENINVDLILAEHRFILTKAKVSEPCPDINGRALASHSS